MQKDKILENNQQIQELKLTIQDMGNKYELQKTEIIEKNRQLEELALGIKDIENKLELSLSEKKEIIETLSNELNFVKSSKFWKLREWDFRVKFVLFHPILFFKKYSKLSIKTFQKTSNYFRKYGSNESIKRMYVDLKSLGKVPIFVKTIQVIRSAVDRTIGNLYRFKESFLLLKRIPAEYLNFHGKINIAFQIESFDKGGLEEVVFSLIRNIGEDNSFNLYILVNENKLGSLGNKAKEKKIKIILLDNNRYFLSKIVKKLHIDIVNLHYSVFGADLYEKYQIPIIYTIHNNYIWADKKFVRERGEIYKNFKKFIAVSDQVKEFFSKRFGIDTRKIITIPNGLDSEVLKAISDEKRKDYNFSENDFVFINVSSFNWNKFHILLVEAMKRLITKYPNFKMLFVGNVLDGKCFEYIMNKIKKNSLSDKIRVLDYVPKEKVLGLMKISDCFVLPSIIEGWNIRSAW